MNKLLQWGGIAAGLFVAAGAAFAAGNPEQGKLKNSMCIGCHGIQGYRTAFPEVYPVPKIAGQHADYIVAALKGYKDGSRSHPSMNGIAASLTEQDMQDLAAYYAKQ